MHTINMIYAKVKMHDTSSVGLNSLKVQVDFPFGKCNKLSYLARFLIDNYDCPGCGALHQALIRLHIQWPMAAANQNQSK